MQSAGIQAEVLLSAMVGVEWQNFLPRLLGRRGDLPSLGGIRNVHGVVDIATGLSSWRRGGSFSQGGFRGMGIAGWAGSGSIPGVKQAWGHHCHLAPATFPLRTAEVALDFLQTLLGLPALSHSWSMCSAHL